MRHTDWLRLKTQGENICAVLRQQGYQCRKQNRRLSWKVSKESISYVLTWLPTPIDEWSLIPKNTEPERSKIMSLVQSALSEDKGILKPDDQAEDAENLEQRCPRKPISTSPHLGGDSTRPWVIVRLLPDLRRYTVARFYNRSDALDHKRTLNRFMPAAEFEVVFDHPETENKDEQA